MFGPASLRVLVVEDEPLLAMDLEMTLEDCGHTVAGEAVCLHTAEALADDTDPQLALVDLQLAHNTNGFDVSAMIQRRWPGAVIVFVTANPNRVPADFAGAHGVLPKPFSHKGLVDTLAYLTETIIDPPPVTKPPASFRSSPVVRARWCA